jgi:hypothetical protein
VNKQPVDDTETAAANTGNVKSENRVFLPGRSMDQDGLDIQVTKLSGRRRLRALTTMVREAETRQSTNPKKHEEV